MSESETKEKTKVVVELEYDHDVDSPSDKPDGSDGRCNWTLYSFSNRHASYKSPEEIFEYDYETGDWKPDEELAEKLRVGHAFFLGYFEHGMCNWHLSGEKPPGTEVDYRWDGVSKAGLLVWYYPEEDMDAKTYEDRQADARCFLEEYTNWANGDCYRARVYEVTRCSECSQEAEGDEVQTFGGFIGQEWVLEAIKEVTEGCEVIRVEGAAGYGVDIEEVQG